VRIFNIGVYERMDINIYILSKFTFYTLAEGIMISVRSFQRSEGDVSDPIKYICIFLISITRRVDLAMSVCSNER